MKLWAVKQRNGDFMLTAFKPLKCQVRGTDFSDWYMKQGDPIGVRHLCRRGFETLTGLAASEFGDDEMKHIELTVEVLL